MDPLAFPYAIGRCGEGVADGVGENPAWNAGYALPPEKGECNERQSTSKRQK
jgi:hypothetical protein